ncbi:hypothetical protein MKW94_016266 [Papaver nudicaule]|uniref:Pentatricopeptide repeat-containing protein n=1 Tax=Papaver nudicaule TaxID=74823 RepID=A0AA41SLP2_PAPNU|nr:hypothetical protein [Papaver nudicaule]
MFYARNLFEEIPLRDRDVFIWNTLIRDYKWVFTRSLYFSFCHTVLQGFIGLERRERSTNDFVQSSLVAMYSRNGEMSSSEMVFGEIVEKDVVTWTSLIAGYVQNGWFMEGLDGFRRMVGSGIQPNMVTFVSILPACAALNLLCFGKMSHGSGIKLGVDSDVLLANTLISMYGKCSVDGNGENVNRARSLFDRMIVRDMVSWNAMIAVYEQNKLGSDAIKLFEECYLKMSIFRRWSRLSFLVIYFLGRSLPRLFFVTSCICRRCCCLFFFISCLLELARDVFARLPERTVVSWTAMIYACAVNGHGNDALEMFPRMLKEKVKPNSFTFIAVLTACKHSGLVEEGRNITRA